MKSSAPQTCLVRQQGSPDWPGMLPWVLQGNVRTLQACGRAV